MLRSRMIDCGNRRKSGPPRQPAMSMAHARPKAPASLALLPRVPSVATPVKLSRPRLAQVFRRTRLFRRLDEARAKPVAWITGPPGAGKTTLIASYAESRGVPTLWYQLDAGDHDVATFFHYLAMGASRLARGCLQLPAFAPHHATELSAFSRRFFRSLHAQLPERSLLVLDDWQEVAPSSRLGEVLRDAVAELRPPMSIMVASRAEPPATLARLRVHGELYAIGSVELKLTAEESTGIARKRGRMGRKGDGLASLHQRVDGWVAGLVLLLAAAEGHGDAPPPAGEPARVLFDYFAGEVLDRMPRERSRVLLELALLPRVTEALALRLWPGGAAAATLAELSRAGYFTVRHSSAYSFHPLFHQFLLIRGEEQVAADRRQEVRKAAAAILADEGHLEDAVSLLLASAAWDELATLIVGAASAMLGEGRAETVRSWILKLPAAARADHPWLSLWLGLASFHHGPALARAELQCAFDAFRERGDAAGAYLAWATLVDTHLFEWGDFFPLDLWMTALEQLRLRWPSAPAPEIEDQAALGVFTALMYRQPSHKDLPGLERSLSAVAVKLPCPAQRGRMGLSLFNLAFLRGDLRRCSELLDELRPATGKADPFTAVAWHMNASRYHFTSGDGRAALREVDAGLALARQSGVPFWNFALRANGGLAAIIEEDLPLAELHLDALREAVGLDQRHNLRFHDYLRGAVALRRGDLEQAIVHLASALEHACASGSPYAEGWCHYATAALLARGTDHAGVELHLGAAERVAVEADSQILRYWTSLLRADLALRNGGQDPAQHLRRALEVRRRFGPYFELWIPREGLARLCSLALERDIDPAQAQEIIRRHGLLPLSDAAPRTWPWPVVVRTFGSFQLFVDGAPIRFGRKSPQKLLELLQAMVVLGGADLPEEKLSDMLWPDSEGDAARHALETDVYRLRKLLGNSELLTQRGRRLSLDRRRCWVDAWALEAALQRARALPPVPDAIEELVQMTSAALEIYQGPFLHADERRWAQGYSERIQRKLASHLEEVERRLAPAGRGREASELWRRAMERDPGLEALR